MILVTGAGGTVGSELGRQLDAARIPFHAGYSTPEKAGRARQAGLQAVHAPFGEPETLRVALRGVEALFLLSGWSPSQTQLEINVVREAKKAGVRRIVKLSVWGAEGEDFSFAKAHRPVEREIEASRIAWTFLRPNGFMQNLSNFSGPSIKARGAFHQPAGEARISHVDVRDIAAVALKALTATGHEGRAYDLSGPEALTYGQIAEKLSAVIGRKVLYVEVTADQFKQWVVSAGVPEAYADAVVDLTRYYIAGRAARISPDVKRVTGNDPISFDRYARDHDWAFR
ncbi:MAG TPA: SDR family oxidoreductase [Candidatus Polarisedimenticolia bacterium]|jgi:uncharacterized protein YbjT (DUF2867 family)